MKLNRQDAKAQRPPALVIDTITTGDDWVYSLFIESQEGCGPEFRSLNPAFARAGWASGRIGHPDAHSSDAGGNQTKPGAPAANVEAVHIVMRSRQCGRTWARRQMAVA